MPQLGLLLWLVVTPSATFELPLDQAARPCEAARELTARGPCLRPEDCGAYRGWKQLFGAPKTAPLDPQPAVRPARGAGRIPSTYLCLASARSDGREPGSR